MNKTGPIILIKDNIAEQKLFAKAFKELNYENQIIHFIDGDDALTHLLNSDDKPFIIFSDIKMSRLDGLELREKMHNNEALRLRCIPYLFFSSSGEQQHVIDAYSKSVQGFFVKPICYERMLVVLKKIVDYWQECESPNYVR